MLFQRNGLLLCHVYPVQVLGMKSQGSVLLPASGLSGCVLFFGILTSPRCFFLVLTSLAHSPRKLDEVLLRDTVAFSPFKSFSPCACRPNSCTKCMRYSRVTRCFIFPIYILFFFSLRLRAQQLRKVNEVLMSNTLIHFPRFHLRFFPLAPAGQAAQKYAQGTCCQFSPSSS